MQKYSLKINMNNSHAICHDKHFCSVRIVSPSCSIHTDAVINDEWRTLLDKYLPLNLFAKFERVVWGYTVRGSWRPNKLQYFDPHSYGRQRCVFLVLLMLNRRPRSPLWCVMAFFTASYQQLPWTPTHQSPNGPFGLMWLSLPHLVYNSARSLTATHPGPQGPFGLMWLYLPPLIHLRLQL